MRRSVGRIHGALWSRVSFSVGVSSPRPGLGALTLGVARLVAPSPPWVTQQRWLSVSSPGLKDWRAANSEEEIADAKTENKLCM